MTIQKPNRSLQSFCIAAKCLSFKQAAIQLCLTPSAVSHQIKQLEQQLDIVLFVRQTRAIVLTNEGKQFYSAVQPLISNLEATILDFTNTPQNTNITISLPEFFASELFVPRLSEWAKVHPNINLKLETAKHGDIPSQTCDLSIVLANSKPDGTLVHDLFPIRYVPACNKKTYEKWAELGYEALKSIPLILHQSRPWSWHQWADCVNIRDFDPKQIIQFDSMFGVARAAQQGMGIALVPLPISNTWFSEQLLVKLFEDELITKDRYYLIQHQNVEPANELSTFAKWVHNSLAI